MAALTIDLNCDLGEGCGADAELMPLVTSANVSCGFHAGDASTARAALALAARHDVRVGAHPGYAERETFGRRELVLREEEVYELCLYQVGALTGLTLDAGRPLRYLKPHGALYNQACRDAGYARPVLAAAEKLALPLLALPGSQLEALAKGRVRFIAEGFADRRYLPDGTLVPRARPDAFIEDAAAALAQAEWLMRERGVRSLCVHGDNPAALAFVRALRDGLTERGYLLRAFA
jgi:5-oxoprolinase (ATP-hydrolysing) subunit A